MLGAGLRIYQYVWERSLWVDEAALANNILSRSLAGLAGPLSENQTAPLGFLWLEKITTLLLGGSEFALRLVPLLFGLLSLALMWLVARRLLAPVAALIAFALFAVSPRLIYYSAEVKQYSSDVAIGLALLLAFLWVREQGLTRSRATALGVAGAAALFFSLTAAFYLAAIALALAYDHRRRIGHAAADLAAVAMLWAASFTANYALGRTGVANEQYMETWWANGFLPLPPKSLAEVAEWGSALLRMFRDPLGFTVPLLALLAFLAGVVWMAASPPRRLVLILVLGPVLMTMLASGLGLYPFGDTVNFGGRVLLFLAPCALLLVGEGIDRTRVALGVRDALLAVVLLLPFVWLRADPSILVPLYRSAPSSTAHVIIPPLPRFDIDSQPVGQVMRRLQAERRPGEPVYVYTTALPTVRYYARRLGIDEADLIPGHAVGDDLELVARDMEALHGRGRVWLFFAYARGDAHIPFIQQLNSAGSVVHVIEDGPVGALLYDLSGS